MAIEFTCLECSRKLRVADDVAGKRIKCPQCKSVVRVPANEAGGDAWYMKAEDGNDYGPVPKDEMDGWVAEGRVTADCQLLQEGEDQWQWATDVYPQLLPSQAAPAAPQAPAAPAPAPPAQSNNPFAGLGGDNPPAKPAGDPFTEGGDSASGASGGAFDFGDSSGTSGSSRTSTRGRGGRRRKKGNGKRSGLVTVVAVLMFLGCASTAIFSLVFMVRGSAVISLILGAGVDDAAIENAASTGGAVIVLVGFGGLLFAAFYGFTGYLLIKRSETGRIIAICIYGLGAFSIVAGFIGAIATGGLGGLIVAIPGTIIGGAISGFVLWVLLNRDIAAEFG